MDSIKFKIKGIEFEISYRLIFTTVAILLGIILLFMGYVTLVDIKEVIRGGKEFIK